MERPMSAQPESFAERMLHEIASDVKDLARTLRGHNGSIGLVAKVDRLEERLAEILDDRAEQKRLKLYRDGSQEAKWKAWAIWGGVALAFVGAIVDALKALTGG